MSVLESVGENASGEAARKTVVAGDVVVYRDAIARLLDAPAVSSDSVDDDTLVVLCPNGHGAAEVKSLTAEDRRTVLVVGVADSDALAYYRAGAFLVLGPDTPPEKLLVAVEQARRGERNPSPGQTTLVFDEIREMWRPGREERTCKLTRRELEVAELLAEDVPDKEIARRLCLSVSTVKKHVMNVRFKLEVQSRRQVAGRLRNAGVLGPHPETF